MKEINVLESEKQKTLSESKVYIMEL